MPLIKMTLEPRVKIPSMIAVSIEVLMKKTIVRVLDPIL